jgi:hypothetical protein
VTSLADAVLPLIRSRAGVSRWSAANAQGRQMHEAVDLVESAILTMDPAEIYAVTHKALASAIKVIARADDSSGTMGDACRRLLEVPAMRPAMRPAVPAGGDWRPGPTSLFCPPTAHPPSGRGGSPVEATTEDGASCLRQRARAVRRLRHRA